VTRVMCNVYTARDTSAPVQASTRPAHGRLDRRQCDRTYLWRRLAFCDLSAFGTLIWRRATLAEFQSRT
jgi:hypothetical protein